MRKITRMKTKKKNSRDSIFFFYFLPKLFVLFSDFSKILKLSFPDNFTRFSSKVDNWQKCEMLKFVIKTDRAIKKLCFLPNSAKF